MPLSQQLDRIARLPCDLILGHPQHIIQRGNHRPLIFAAERNLAFFRDSLVEAAVKHRLGIHAYAWVTNHVHLPETPEFEHSISKALQSVGRRYVQYFNFTYRRSRILCEGADGDVVLQLKSPYREGTTPIGLISAAN